MIKLRTVFASIQTLKHTVFQRAQVCSVFACISDNLLFRRRNCPAHGPPWPLLYKLIFARYNLAVGILGPKSLCLCRLADLCRRSVLPVPEPARIIFTAKCIAAAIPSIGFLCGRYSTRTHRARWLDQTIMLCYSVLHFCSGP